MLEMTVCKYGALELQEPEAKKGLQRHLARRNKIKNNNRPPKKVHFGARASLKMCIRFRA